MCYKGKRQYTRKRRDHHPMLYLPPATPPTQLHRRSNQHNRLLSIWIASRRQRGNEENLALTLNTSTSRTKLTREREFAEHKERSVIFTATSRPVFTWPSLFPASSSPGDSTELPSLVCRSFAAFLRVGRVPSIPRERPRLKLLLLASEDLRTSSNAPSCPLISRASHTLLNVPVPSGFINSSVNEELVRVRPARGSPDSV